MLIEKRFLMAVAALSAWLAAPESVLAQAQFSIFHAASPGFTPVATIRAADGMFYGTTLAQCCNYSTVIGTAFAMTPDGISTELHQFTTSEGIPNALIQARDGNLYVTTTRSAFRMSTSGVLALLHTFTSTEGANPSALIQGVDGNFYGTARSGGSFGGGTVFRMAPDGAVTVLHAFSGGVADGWVPLAPPVQAADGTLYGTTTLGGALGLGTVFKLTSDGSFSILQSVFSHDGDYSPRPMPGVTLASDGNLYGVVPHGKGLHSEIFRLAPDGTFTILRRFDLSYDLPSGPPVEASDRSLYGLTWGGIVYKILLDGSVEMMTLSGLDRLYDFGFTTLIPANDGYLYGNVRTWLDIPSKGFGFRINVPMPSLMTIDVPAPEQVVAEPFVFGGWAVDLGANPVPGPGIDAVHVWAFPVAGGTPTFVGAARYGVDRPDVAAVYGARFEHSGYDLEVRGLAPGSYRLDAFAHRLASGKFDLVRSVVITIASPQPHIEIDTPGAVVGSRFVIAGWSLDLAAATDTGVNAVHVWAYPNPGSGSPPVFLGAAAYGGSRPDVGAVFGGRFTNSGFSLTVTGLAPGSYRLALFALSAATNLFSAPTVRDITVRAGNPIMSLDAPGDHANVGTTVAIWGWAADTDALSGTGVDAIHVWAFPTSGAPIFLGAAHYGESRPDVGAIFGSQFTNTGYSLLARGLAPGSYQLTVSARSTLTYTFNQSRTVSLTVH